jgi:hypothetical protein
MPELHRIRDNYADRGLQLIFVHRPMSESDLDEEAVRTVADELGIAEPLIFDNDHKIGDELGVNAWPTYFLIDSNGKVRRHTKGQSGVKMIEQALIRLFDEEKSSETEAVTESSLMTISSSGIS